MNVHAPSCAHLRAYLTDVMVMMYGTFLDAMDN